jgi:hypothetical protein
VNPLDLAAAPHQRFPVQGHIVSAEEDALMDANLTPKCQRTAKYFEKQTKLVHPDN